MLPCPGEILNLTLCATAIARLRSSQGMPRTLRKTPHVSPQTSSTSGRRILNYCVIASTIYTKLFPLITLLTPRLCPPRLLRHPFYHSKHAPARNETFAG